MVNAKDIEVGSRVTVLDPTLICFGEDLDIDENGTVEVKDYAEGVLWLKVREDAWGYSEGFKALQILENELSAIDGVYYG